MYVVYDTCTLYGCQVAGEKLSKAVVAEQALRLGDEAGVEAVTIRRLAQELGVTPMALYWHFKNKDELLQGVVDYALTGVRADRSTGDPWQKQLRTMCEALVAVMRAHPCLPDLVFSVEKDTVASFNRAAEDALDLLTDAGFAIQESWWISTYLLHGAIGLVRAQPDCPSNIPPDQATEWRRQRRLTLERLPADQFPKLVAFAGTYGAPQDSEEFYSFGIDLLMAAASTPAISRSMPKE